MARVLPQIGMEVTVEGFAGRDAGVVVGVEDGARRVIVECDGEQLAFTLRRLTGRYVQERQPYYGVRLKLVPVADRNVELGSVGDQARGGEQPRPGA